MWVGKWPSICMNVFTYIQYKHVQMRVGGDSDSSRNNSIYCLTCWPSRRGRDVLWSVVTSFWSDSDLICLQHLQIYLICTYIYTCIYMYPHVHLYTETWTQVHPRGYYYYSMLLIRRAMFIYNWNNIYIHIYKQWQENCVFVWHWTRKYPYILFFGTTCMKSRTH